MPQRSCDDCKHQGVFGMVAYCEGCIHKGADKWEEKEEEPLPLYAYLGKAYCVPPNTGKVVDVDLMISAEAEAYAYFKQRIKESLANATMRSAYKVDPPQYHKMTNDYLEAFSWILD